MRIIAGSARGTRLAAPKDRDIRPTLDRVRESLFNILAPRLTGTAFLDLFAGTGANGIEALSRGADRCVFVDNDERSLDLVRRNLALARLTERGKAMGLALPEGLGRLSGKFDIVFADPPYAFTEYAALFQALAEAGLVQPTGLIVLEHDIRANPAAEPTPFTDTRRATYGDTALTFFELGPRSPS